MTRFNRGDLVHVKSAKLLGVITEVFEVDGEIVYAVLSTNGDLHTLSKDEITEMIRVGHG
jgi:CRISPR/Cas system-associated protein Csx1